MRRQARRLGLGFGTLLGVALLGKSAPAAAQEQNPLGSHQRHLRFELGERTQFVSHAGLDPFSTNDAIPQVTTGASYAFYANDQLSVAASLLWDYGNKSDTARNAPSSLTLHRFALGPELRYHVLRILSLGVRLAPTLLSTQAELDDGAVGALAESSWTFGVDASAGAAVELFGYASGASKKPRLWLIAEGGYGWSAPTDLKLEPKDPGPDTPNRLLPLDLGELSVSGPLFRVAAAVSF